MHERPLEIESGRRDKGDSLKLSVVVPTYNRRLTLRKTLAALLEQDYPDYETIVVDDGSTDGTREMVEAEFPLVRYVCQKNRGPAAARNAGIRAANGEIVAFTDDDCVAPSNWLAGLAGGYARYPQVAGVGGYLEAPDEVLSCALLARYESHMARRMYGVGERERVDGFESAAGGTNNMSYRRDILQQVSGFDESFRYAAGEDADLKWRICSLGYRLLYVPLRVIHLQAYTWSHFRRQSFFRGRGRMQYELRRGRNLGPVMLLGRSAAAFLRFPADFATMPEKPFAFARLVENLCGVAGQWAELGRS